MNNLYRIHPQPSFNALGNEAGGQATFVSWRATAHGGKKKQKRGKR